MCKGQPVRVQRLTGKFDRAELIRSIHIAALAYEGMSTQSRLKTDLVAFARLQAYFDQRRLFEPLEQVVPADSVLSTGIAWMGLLLDERLPIPHQSIFPDTGGRIGMAVHDRAVDALHRVTLELILQGGLRRGVLCKHDKARR